MQVQFKPNLPMMMNQKNIFESRNERSISKRSFIQKILVLSMNHKQTKHHSKCKFASYESVGRTVEQ
jgi:hypothetical protein